MPRIKKVRLATDLLPKNRCISPSSCESTIRTILVSLLTVKDRPQEYLSRMVGCVMPLCGSHRSVAYIFLRLILFWPDCIELFWANVLGCTFGILFPVLPVIQS